MQKLLEFLYVMAEGAAVTVDAAEVVVTAAAGAGCPVEGSTERCRGEAAGSGAGTEETRRGGSLLICQRTG